MSRLWGGIKEEPGVGCRKGHYSLRSLSFRQLLFRSAARIKGGLAQTTQCQGLQFNKILFRAATSPMGRSGMLASIHSLIAPQFGESCRVFAAPRPASPANMQDQK